jgi:hypothetical protein
MKKHLLGLRGAVLVMAFALACKGDPTVGLVGGVSTVTPSLTYVTVNVGDSILVNAAVRDEAGNPVPVAATAVSNTTGVVTVSPVSGAPLEYSNFFVKGITFGTGSITVTAGAATSTINVKTYPAAIAIVGSRDSMLSGATRTMTYQSLDQSQNVITVVDTFTWSSSNTAVISVDPVTGVLTAKSAGIATIKITGPGSPASVVATAQLSVVPAPFGGTLSATSGIAATQITLTKAASDPAFDADVAATVGGVPTYVTKNTGTTIDVVIPPLGKAGVVKVLVTNIGSGQLARSFDFTSNSATYDDANTPANEDPTTAPAITANGEYFAVVHGECAAGGGGGASQAGDVCDKFFMVTNSTGGSITLSLQADWAGGTDSDVDMITCNATCSGSFGVAGATGANPEKANLTIAAGVTRVIWFNNFAPAVPAILVRLTVISGLP